MVLGPLAIEAATQVSDLIMTTHGLEESAVTSHVEQVFARRSSASFPYPLAYLRCHVAHRGFPLGSNIHLDKIFVISVTFSGHNCCLQAIKINENNLCLRNGSHSGRWSNGYSQCP